VGQTAPGRQHSARVSQAQFGHRWPLTVDCGVLFCDATGDQGGVNGVYFTAPDGTVYAVNGTARNSGDYPDIDPIWAPDRGFGKGVKKDIGVLIDKGLRLC
jgi:hypothetical protein